MSHEPYYLILATFLELEYFSISLTENNKLNFQKETSYYIKSFINTAERRWRDWSKNLCEGLMDMDNSVGKDYGSGEQAGWREAKGKKLGQL